MQKQFEQSQSIKNEEIEKMNELCENQN